MSKMQKNMFCRRACRWACRWFCSSLLLMIAVGMIGIGMIGCAGPRQQPLDPVRSPTDLRAAVEEMTRQLLDDAVRQQGLFHAEAEKVFAIDPFEDADSGEVPQVSRTIEEMMIDYARKAYPDFRLARLSSDILADADYVISGTIGLERFGERKEMEGRYYHLRAKVRDLEKIQVIGAADVWIEDQNLDYTPTALYRDNPMYIREAEKRTPSAAQERDYIDNLKTEALLVEGATAYEAGNYEKALALFQRADGLSGGKSLKTYAGLYMAHQKLGNEAQAQETFGRMVAISVEDYNTLTVKFLFDVNSAAFKKDAGLKAKYDKWLDAIGRYFDRTDRCIKIVGHSSRTGSESWNKGLSLQRAQSIRKILQASFPEVMEKSGAVGMGFEENIVGTGTDDERDALDRRVEIIPVECGGI